MHDLLLEITSWITFINYIGMLFLLNSRTRTYLYLILIIIWSDKDV